VLVLPTSCCLSLGCFPDFCISFCKTYIAILCRIEFSHILSSDEDRRMQVNYFHNSLCKVFGTLNMTALKTESVSISSFPFINLKN
jgi:hypothetical protein